MKLVGLLVIVGLLAGGQQPQVQKGLSTTTCPGDGCVTLGVQGLNSVGVQVTGTWSATLTFEASLDGVTYATFSMTPSNSTTTATTTTGNGVWRATIGGMVSFRVRASAYASGTAMVTIQGAALPE